jgi:serine/threonine-protein kinase
MSDDGYDLFDDDDGDFGTLVDSSFWSQGKVPDYPPLAYFGRFEILGRIARGGMAEVYLAREWDESGKARHLVVKRVLPEMETQPELLQMFLDEGVIATRLYHDNICHVYECGEVDGKTFMALEWVWGPSMQDVIRRAAERSGVVPWPVAAKIIAQVAGALHYVHHAKGVNARPLNIVHRDVSPHNVIISWAGSVKLLDFGIAKTTQEASGGGGAVGKYAYMSPEQAQSQRVDPRSDIFSLGICLYEILTGRALYDRETLLDTLSAVVREPVPSLKAQRPELPDALEHVVRRALAKDPAQRFQSAGELRAALEQILRAGGQSVSEQRVALSIDGLFDTKEKEPLQAESKQLTGSFQALTAEGAAAISAASQDVAYETFSFDHAPSEPPPPLGASFPPPIGAAAPAAAPKRRRALFLWLGLGLVAIAMASAWVAVAIYLLG